MTVNDLQQQAREAAREKVANCFGEQHLVEPIDLNAQRALKAARYAFLAAAEPREKEIEAMKDACQKWEWNSAETMAVLMGCEAKVTMQKEEIATLRARVAELEGRDRSAVALLRKWKYGWTFGRYVPVEESQAFINAAPIPMPGAEG